MGQSEAILSLHNSRAGRTFLVGNGSTLLEDIGLLPRLDSEDTWTCNYFPKWGNRPFEPTYYALSENHHVDRRGIHQFAWPGFDQPVRFAFHRKEVRSHSFLTVKKGAVDRTIMNGGPVGLTGELPAIPLSLCTMFYCVQLALWMGYEEIYLLGNEFTDTGYAWDPTLDRAFDNVMAKKIEAAASMMREYIEASGRSFVDCTPNGRLGTKGILGFRSLEEVLNG